MGQLWKSAQATLRNSLWRNPALDVVKSGQKNENVKHTFGTSSRSSQTQKQETKKKKLKRKEK